MANIILIAKINGFIINSEVKEMKKFLLVLICALTIAFAQANDRMVRDAQRALSQRNHGTVVRIYETFADTASANNPTFEFLEPLYIEALLSSPNPNHEEIARLSIVYIGRFPNSQQVARVFYLLGVAKANIRDFSQAVVALDEGLKRTTGSRDRSLRETDRAIRNLLTRLSQNHIDDNEREVLLIGGISEATAEILRSHRTATQGGQAVSAQEQQARRPVRGGAMRINRTIGLLVPMTGEFAALGQVAHNTVAMFLARHEERTGERFTLKVYDTEGSAIRTAQRVNELLADSVSMVIGPIMSNTSTVAAAVLSQFPDRAAMITPTATDDGIAALGSNVFQLNLTSKALAVKIAEYAIENLNIRNFTILAPLDDYGRTMTAYFTEAVSQRGATVDFTEYYSPTATDFRRQFGAVREFFTDRRFANGNQTPEARASYLSDSTISLGGLFLPVSSPDNAIQLAAQVPFHRLNAQILGTPLWGHERVLSQGRRTVNDVSFSTANRIDPESERVQNFVEAYRVRYGEAPDLIVAPLVADAIQLMLRAYAQSNTVSQLSENLMQVSGFQGLSSEITFKNTAGVNTGAIVNKISNQRIIRVR